MNKTVLTIFIIPFLLACQNNGQKAPQLPSGSPVNTQGPSDGGGGDTCNGKMIESYKVDITELDEFKEFIQPILNKVAGKQGDKPNSSPFLISAKIQNWYLIDCKLQNISNERKGLYLETYQTAIHTSREIFIDSNSYKKMAKEEKAKLLLHEMIMSFYLMKYLSLEELCKMSGSCSGDFGVFAKWKMFRPEPYRPLDAQDHQKIRNVTAWLWSERDSLSFENFAKVIKNNDFDKRFSISDAGSSDSKDIDVDIQTLLRMLKKYQWAHSFPIFCNFDDVTNVSGSNCQTEVLADIRDYNVTPEAKIKQLYVKIKITRDSDKKEFDSEFSYPLTSENQKITLHMNKFGSILSAAPFALTVNWPYQQGFEAHEGLRSKMLFLMLNLSDQNNPEIYQAIFQTYIWYSFEDETVKKDGATIIETYGYPELLPKESENLFLENELPFKLNSFLQNKVLVKSRQSVN